MTATPPMTFTVVVSDAQAEEIEAAMAAAAAAVGVATPEAAALVRRLAQAAVPVSGDVYPGCDGCDIGEYSQVVVEAVDDLPPPAEARNPWDDVAEVVICPFCVLADENAEPPSDLDEVPADEMERIIREEQALAEGDPS